MASNPKQIVIFDMMRNRSHLFFRWLGTHPDIQDIWHPFLAAFLNGPERLVQHTVNFDKDGKEIKLEYPLGDVTYADATKGFLEAVKEAERQHKILVANEHCPNICKQDITLALLRNQPVPQYSNPTVIPDQMFNSLTPIFVIRRPVFSVPSNYIAATQTTQILPGGEDWRMITGVMMQRQIFDHFCNRDGKPPLVIDGDDVIWRNDEIREKLSKGLGLDPKGFSQVWQPVPEEARHKVPMIRYFLQTIDDSTGIQRPSEKAPDADLEKAYHKWCDQYGQDVADQLRSTVEQNMPHYEHMAQFKV